MKPMPYEVLCNDVVVAYAESLHLATIILKSIFDSCGNVQSVSIRLVKDNE